MSPYHVLRDHYAEHGDFLIAECTHELCRAYVAFVQPRKEPAS